MYLESSLTSPYVRCLALFRETPVSRRLFPVNKRCRSGRPSRPPADRQTTCLLSTVRLSKLSMLVQPRVYLGTNHEIRSFASGALLCDKSRLFSFTLRCGISFIVTIMRTPLQGTSPQITIVISCITLT